MTREARDEDFLFEIQEEIFRWFRNGAVLSGFPSSHVILHEKNQLFVCRVIVRHQVYYYFLA